MDGTGDLPGDPWPWLAPNPQAIPSPSTCESPMSTCEDGSLRLKAVRLDAAACLNEPRNSRLTQATAFLSTAILPAMLNGVRPRASIILPLSASITYCRHGL